MNYEEFEKRKRLTGHPVYAVVGDEPFLKQRALDRIVAQLTRGAEGRFGLRTADMEGPEEQRPAGAGELLADLLTPSLFAKTTVVAVRRADKLLAKGGSADAILDFLDAPGAAGALVLDLKSVDGRTRVGRTLKEKGMVVECKRLFDKPPPWKPDAPRHDNPLSHWIVREGRRAGLSLALPVAQALADRVGNNLAGLAEEIDKLALFKGAGGDRAIRVDESDVAASVGDYNDFGIFRLTDAVGSRNLEEALRIAGALFEQGLRSFGKGGTTTSAEPGVAAVIVGRLHAKLREVFRARAILDGGGGAGDVQTGLGKHRAFVQGLVEEARRFPLSAMDAALDALFRADRALKTGGGGRRVVERLLVEIL